jgi:hypothetical protein
LSVRLCIGSPLHQPVAGNPVESLWSHAEYTALANFVPDDVNHLEDAVIEAVGDTHFKLPLLRSFFHAAKFTL